MPGRTRAGLRTRAHREQVGDRRGPRTGSRTWGSPTLYIVFVRTDPDAGARMTHLRVHRRGRTALGFLGRASSSTDRHPRVAHGPAVLRVRSRDGGQPHRRLTMRVQGAMGPLDRSRLGIAAQAVGIAQGATDYAAAYARSAGSSASHRSSPAIQFKLDRDSVDQALPSARELLYRAGQGRRRRRDSGTYRADGEAVRIRHRDVGDDGGGPQVLGGYGYVERVAGRADDARRQDHQIYEAPTRSAAGDPRRSALTEVAARTPTCARRSARRSPRPARRGRSRCARARGSEHHSLCGLSSRRERTPSR